MRRTINVLSLIYVHANYNKSKYCLNDVIYMKKICAAILIVLFFVQSAFALVLDFEDLSGQAVMPDGYAGLTWDPNWYYYGWTQPPFNPSSGSYRIYTHNYGGWIEFNELVDFKGAYFAGTGTTCYFNGYRNNVLIATSGSVTVTSTPYFLNAGFTEPIDKVDIVCDQYNFFVVDDLEFEPSSMPAPEFGTLAVAALIVFLAPAFGFVLVRIRK